MKTSSSQISTLCFALITIISCQESNVINLRSVREIRNSGRVVIDTAFVEGRDGKSAIRVLGNNLDVDFNDCLVLGTRNMIRPDKMQGIGLEVQGTNITIRNLKVAGYRTAIFAKNVNGLKIIDCDLSYNYRPNLEELPHTIPVQSERGTPDVGIESAAVLHLTNCPHIIVSNLRVHQSQHGIYLENCSHAQIMGCDIRFNSGVALSLIDSDSNVIKNNLLDYNVGSLSRTAKGEQLSSGVLDLDNLSKGNLFEKNSMTHALLFSATDGYLELSKNAISDNVFGYNLDSITPTLRALQKENGLGNQDIDSLPISSPLRGKQFILINAWGPYNFEYPSIWLREANGGNYTFALLGPEGNWRVTGANGFENGSLKSGTFPNSLTAIRTNDDRSASISLEFIGTSFMNQFGYRNLKGQTYPFRFHVENRARNGQVK